MGRIKALNRYQKGILLVMILMTLIFAVVYFKTISKVGYEYRDTILVLSQENGNTIYSGEIQGKQAQFTVTEDKTVTFQYGNKTFGPYTAKEDPSAVPEEKQSSSSIIGVELLRGEEIWFRGGVGDLGNRYLLYNEDGSVENIKVTYTTGDGIERDKNGNIINPMEPTVSDVLELMEGPELTHKGVWYAWALAVFICIANACSMLFADELFRLSLIFTIRNVDDVEPTDFEIAGRYFCWTALTIMAFVILVSGLQ